MKTTPLVLILMAGFAAAAPKKGPEFSTPKARQARQAHEQELERLKAEYDAKVLKAKATYLKALESALKEARKAKHEADVDGLDKTIAGLRKEVGELAGAAGKRKTTKAAKRETIGRFSFTGGAGLTQEAAVVIGGAEDSAEAVEAQGLWLRAHYPRHRKTQQALLTSKGEEKTYDRITIESPEGEVKEIYFDITDCFGFPE